MIKKSLYLIFIILIFTSVIFFVLQNSSDVDVMFAPETALFNNQAYSLTNVNLGVILICAVAVGFLVAWMFSAFLLFKGLIRRKRVEYDVKRKEHFIDSILVAREESSDGNWTKANSEWQKLKKQDPSKVLSNVEISRVLENEGNIQTAITVIDEARAAAPRNIEVLYRAAELNARNHNLTAAVDNLTLILKERPSAKAAVMARNYAESLNRFDDALEYNEQALEAGEIPDYDQAKARILLKRIIAGADLKSSEGKEAYRKELKSFIRQHKNYEGGFVAFAEYEETAGNTEKAAEILFKASQIDGNQKLWHHAVTLWIRNNAPDRALATAKTAAGNTKGLERLRAELDVIKVNLALSKTETAKGLINDFPQLVSQLEVEITEKLKQDFMFLKGLCLNRCGLHQAEADLWIQLADSNLEVDQILKDESPKTERLDSEQLSPEFSTP